MNHKNNLITLSIIFIIVSIIFWGKTGNFLIDFSRETFIPYQMQDQNILIKDILLIYGAFGYIVNWLLYKILTNINMLLFEAHLISYCILILMYFILNIFFSKKASLFLSALFIGVSIFSNSTFSFVVPYSFSTLWAVFGSFLALFSLLYNKKILLFLSLGLILANRIEFFIPIFIISLGYLIYSKEKFKKEFALILIFPAICGLYFLLNKVNFNEIAKNYNYIKEMVNTEAIKYLYKGMGVFFEKEYFTYNIINFFKVVVIFAISHALFFIKKPAISYTFLIICLCFINTTMALNLIGLFSILLTILIHNKKHIKKEELLLFLFAIILSSKAFFALNPLTYSNFGYLLILAYVFLQLQKFINKKWLINSLIIYLFFSSTANITYFYLHKKASFETKTGTIQININEYQLFKNTSDFIKENIGKDETLAVIPEGQIFNLIHRKKYDFFNSTFTPLDFETFGEKTIIERLKKKKTDYIIFYPRNTKDYGKETICYDYGVDFCNYVIDNYIKIEPIENSKKVAIFKIKK